VQLLAVLVPWAATTPATCCAWPALSTCWVEMVQVWALS
jgi:hypothetical protein